MNSIKKQSGFDEVNKFGRRFKSQSFTVVCMKPKVDNNYCSPSSSSILGLKVGKKLGSAVIRNKIKRRIRSLVRESTSCWSGWTFLFIPYKGIERVLYSQLELEFHHILHSIGKKPARRYIS